MAAAVGKHLLENLPGGNSVEEGGAEIPYRYHADELVMPGKESRESGRGWRRGIAGTEAKLRMAETEMHTAWHKLKLDTKDSKLS